MRLKLLITVLVFTLLLICGCKNDNAGVKDAGKTPDGAANKENTENEIDYTSHLVEGDFEGYNFRIFVRPGKVSDIYVEEETGETVDDAVYARNKLVENMYNVTFSATESSSSDIETDAMNTILAGDDAYDLILPHSRAAFSYALQGALMNWYDIPNIDLTKPWWIKDAKDSFTINNKLYVMDGDMCLHSLKYAACLFFNKNIFDELGIDYPYDLVNEGKWTFDKFEELVMQGAKDLNGDGVMVPEDDRYGYIASDWGGAITILYAGGQRIFKTGEDGLPYLSLNNEKTVNLFDRFFKMTDSDYAFCKLSNPKNYNGDDHFKNDRALFQEGSLGGIAGNRDMESDFGVLPYPVFEEGDEYATNINGHAHLICVPITAYNHIDKTGAIMEAMAALGARDVVPAFYEVALQTKYSRDDESAAMMDIVKNTRKYDLGYLGGNTFQSVGYKLAYNTNHDFSSYYASNEAAALKALDTFIENYSMER